VEIEWLQYLGKKAWEFGGEECGSGVGVRHEGGVVAGSAWAKCRGNRGEDEKDSSGGNGQDAMAHVKGGWIDCDGESGDY